MTQPVSPTPEPRRPAADRTGWENAQKAEAVLVAGYGIRSDFPWPIVSELLRQAAAYEALTFPAPVPSPTPDEQAAEERRKRPCNDYAADWRGEHEPHDWEGVSKVYTCPGRSFTRKQRWDQALGGWTVFRAADGVNSIREATPEETRAECMALADFEASVVARERLAAVEALNAALVSALERTRDNFVAAVRGTPVRDMAETLAEADAAVRAVLVGRPPTPHPTQEKP